jgi:hypothetical protein
VNAALRVPASFNGNGAPEVPYLLHKDNMIMLIKNETQFENEFGDFKFVPHY